MRWAWGEEMTIDCDFAAFNGLVTFGLSAVGFMAGFFVGVRAEATQGTFHDSYLNTKRITRWTGAQERLLSAAADMTLSEPAYQDDRIDYVEVQVDRHEYKEFIAAKMNYDHEM